MLHLAAVSRAEAQTTAGRPLSRCYQADGEWINVLTLLYLAIGEVRPAPRKLRNSRIEHENLNVQQAVPTPSVRPMVKSPPPPATPKKLSSRRSVRRAEAQPLYTSYFGQADGVPVAGSLTGKQQCRWPSPSGGTASGSRAKSSEKKPVYLQGAGGGGRRRVVLVPVLRDVLALADPDLVPLALEVVEELGESRGAPGAADQAAVEADRHHLGGSISALLRNQPEHEDTAHAARSGAEGFLLHWPVTTLRIFVGTRRCFRSEQKAARGLASAWHDSSLWSTDRARFCMKNYPGMPRGDLASYWPPQGSAQNQYPRSATGWHAMGTKADRNNSRAVWSLAQEGGNCRHRLKRVGIPRQQPRTFRARLHM